MWASSRRPPASPSSSRSRLSSRPGCELAGIAAVVVGGTLLTGGQGGAGSALIGVLLLGVIFNLFNLEGTISPWWQWVLRGVFLLGVVVVQGRLQRRTA